ncbi:DUF6415 family natural product biosynthesis protein [Streptomyces sp. NPDC012616]|uniref:DUF6415 family natural product biosynthesis protein n=1 Tax=Streptomyces sp. NPDC012616 TaxID=3364840 RepID=UPI0036EA068A
MSGERRTEIDAATIRQSYGAVLGTAGLPKGEVLNTAAGVLGGHVRLLVSELTGLAPRMRGEYRRTAVYVIVRAQHVLAERAGSSLVEQQRDVFDLALLARSLLALWERPGPLGAAVDEGEIERAVERRICGACSQPISRGEGAEAAVFASEASGGLHGYLHTDSCAVVAEELRARLRAVP